MFYADMKHTNGIAQYDPSLFRGCTWVPLNGLVFVVFETGKVVLTGARTWQQALKAYREALLVLARYRLGQEYKEYNHAHKRTRRMDLKPSLFTTGAAAATQMSADDIDDLLTQLLVQ